MANMFVSDAADFDSTTISASSHARAAGTGISGLFRAIADRFCSKIAGVAKAQDRDLFAVL